MSQLSSVYDEIISSASKDTEDVFMLGRDAYSRLLAAAKGDYSYYNNSTRRDLIEFDLFNLSQSLRILQGPMPAYDIKEMAKRLKRSISEEYNRDSVLEGLDYLLDSIELREGRNEYYRELTEKTIA